MASIIKFSPDTALRPLYILTLKCYDVDYPQEGICSIKA